MPVANTVPLSTAFLVILVMLHLNLQTLFQKFLID